MAFRCASRILSGVLLTRSISCSVRCRSQDLQKFSEISVGRSLEKWRGVYNIVKSRAIVTLVCAHRSTAQSHHCFNRLSTDSTGSSDRSGEVGDNPSAIGGSSDATLEVQSSAAQLRNEERFAAQQQSPANVVANSSLKASARHDLAMLFTCNVCGVRSAKTMSRATYETGVVIVRCPGCQNLHLIADRYGWFGDAGSVEDFLAEKGLSVKKGSEESYEFTMEDLSGWTPKEKSKP